MASLVIGAFNTFANTGYLQTEAVRLIMFASKVVEKCLKIGGADFLERYLERVCEGRPDRPRIPLIDSKWN